MFVAIVVPATKASRATMLCVALAAMLNVGLSLLPEGARPSPSLSILAAGVAAAGFCAWLFPAGGTGTTEHAEDTEGASPAPAGAEGKEDAP